MAIETVRDDIVRSNGDRAKTSKYTDQDSLKQKLDKSSTFDFTSLFRTFGSEDDAVPEQAKDNRTRDEFILEYVKQEPNLMGIISSVVEIDKNRGWRLVGGRNQVVRFTDILHNFQAAPGLYGWRPAISASSKAFWNTDMGAVTEVGRAGKKGPVRGFYTVDPTKVALTGKSDYPMKYLGNKDETVYWSSDDYLRTVSLPSTNADLAGLGYCAVSRCLELASLMVAVYEHDKEMLGSRAPRGLLMLLGISQQQWEDAMTMRDATLDAKELEYFGALVVLASKNTDIDAKLTALSQLPKGFNMREWVDLMIYGYALCFGFDAGEFFPVQFGAIGRGTETEVQHEKATAKGRLAFVLGFQEQLQYFLPDSLLFEFEQRDDKGDRIRAESQQAQVGVVTSLYESGLSVNNPLITRDQALAMLADYGVIPSEWVPSEIEIVTDEGAVDTGVTEELEADELELPPVVEESEPEPEFQTNTRLSRTVRDSLLSCPEVFRAAQQYPREPIVQYNFPQNTLITLYASGEALTKTIFTPSVSI